MKNPCYKSKDNQCAERRVGCRDACTKWIEYEKEKNKEYAKRRRDAIALPNTVKAEFKMNYLRRKVGH